MKVEPGARDLIETARAALVNEVIPKLPADQRYAALMAANALAISARALGAPDTDGAEFARIAALLGGGEPGSLGEATIMLATRIRQGAFDAEPARSRLLEHLRATTRERLAVSNPKAIRAT